MFLSLSIKTTNILKWVSCLTWNALGHDGEGDPGSDFVGVVRARDELEEDGERIEGGVWDLAN